MTDYMTIISSAAVVPALDTDWTSSVPASMKRRDPRIWQMAYAAASKVCTSTGLTPESIVVGTALGALDETRGFLDGVFTDGLGSPRSFIASVHNSIAGKLAFEFKVHGPNLTVCESQNSLASSLVVASTFANREYPALVVIIDERIPLMDQVYPHLSPSCKEYLAPDWQEAAVAFMITKAKGAIRFRAKPPRPSQHAPTQHEWQRVAAEYFQTTGVELILDQAKDSYVAPAVVAHRFSQQQSPRHVVVGSYSPSARAYAAVELLHDPR